MDVSRLSKSRIHELENYEITNADGVVCVKDFIHNTIKYRNPNNIMYKPIQCVYDRKY